MILDSNSLTSSGVPNTRSPRVLIPGTTFDNEIPAAIGHTSSANPASGPAMPISNRIRFEKIADRMRMKAPSVPMSVGAGRKNGSVASTR
jgi:hypothetical protein